MITSHKETAYALFIPLNRVFPIPGDVMASLNSGIDGQSIKNIILRNTMTRQYH
jgi:hypothetical protein